MKKKFEEKQIFLQTLQFTPFTKYLGKNNYLFLTDRTTFFSFFAPAFTTVHKQTSED